MSTIPLEGKSVWVLGRSLDSDIVLAHSSISRRHARIFAEDGGFYIDDLSSTHGTVVAGQPLRPGAPTRLFDGLKIGFGSSSFDLVPINMMAAVMQAARREQEAEARRQQEATTAAETTVAASTAHQHGVALLAGGGEAAVAAAKAEATKAAEEEEAMWMGLPMGFGKGGKAAPSLDEQDAANARDATSLKDKRKAAKKGAIKMGANIGVNLGAAIGAGAGLAVPAATPTLAALQEKRASERAAAGPGTAMPPPPPPKRIGASLPERPPASAQAAGMEDDDDDDVGPALPPGFATVAADDGADDDAMGPSLPPGGLQLPSRPGAYDPSDLSQQVFPDTGDGLAGDDDDDSGDEDDGGGGSAGLSLPISHQIVLKGHTKTVTCLTTDRAGGRVATGSSDHDLRLWDFGGMTSELRNFRHIEEPLGGYQLRSLDFSPKYSPRAAPMSLPMSSDEPPHELR